LAQDWFKSFKSQAIRGAKEASMAIRSALLAALSSVNVFNAHADGFLATPTGSEAGVASASTPAANEVDVGVEVASNFTEQCQAWVGGQGPKPSTCEGTNVDGCYTGLPPVSAADGAWCVAGKMTTCENYCNVSGLCELDDGPFCAPTFGVTAEAVGTQAPSEESNVGEVEAEAEGDDEADSSPEEGDVTLEAEAAKGGACVDEKGWDRDFASRMYNCAVKTGVNPRKGGRCMARKQGVSQACGYCMGKLMKCSVKCASQCCNGKCMHSGKCKRCTARKCNRSFFKCAGVQSP